MKPLYEINKDLENLFNEAFAFAAVNDGELPENFQDNLKEIEKNQSIKIGNYARFIKNLQAEYNMIDIEEKKFTKRKKSVNKKIEWLKNNLAFTLNKNQDHKTYEDEISKITWRKSSAVEVTDIEKLESDYIQTEKKPVLSAISEKLKEGIEVDGAILITNYNLQIK